jgi:hypothetical protein
MLRFGWQVRAGMNRRALHIHDNSHPWLGTDTSLKGNEVVGGILVSPCPSVCRQILCRTITRVVFLRIF